jgi:ATP-dependent Clp protease adaptor protein ClpS
MSSTVLEEPAVTFPEGEGKEERATKTQRRTKKQPPYHVVLLNDDDHSFEYVIGMLQQIFGHVREKGERMAYQVHLEGRTIVFTGTRELAELKQEQIHAFGPDKTIPRCEGSMSAELEAAE